MSRPRTRRRPLLALACAAALPAALIAGGARAETLAEAIALAYQANPTLQTARAQLRSLDETYVQARAGWRPTLAATGSISHGERLQPGFFTGAVETTSDTGAAALSATQPLYTGGRTAAAVNAAEAQIRAGREHLRSVEISVMFSVVQAYSDVLRDREALTIQRESLAVLDDAASEIKARFEAGANASTDVAQADAQVEAAHALLNNAQAQLDISVAGYVAAVGQSPGTLQPAPPLAGAPATIDQAFDVGEAQSPALNEARFTEAAGRQRVREARAAQRPTLNLTGSFGDASLSEPFRRTAYDRAATAALTFTMPLYAGGIIASGVRQAVEDDSAARTQIETTRRSVVQSISQAWSQRRSALANVAVDAAQVAAAREAFEGMREEFRAGLRATLDVLIAQQVLRDSRIAEAQVRRDAYVAEAALIGAVGRLEADSLVAGVPQYSAEAAFRRVKDKGGVPWEIVPATIDTLGSPGAGRPQTIPAPSPPAGPVTMRPAETPLPGTR